MNDFFTFLIIISLLGFIILEIINLYHKVTHNRSFYTKKSTNFILATVLIFCVAMFGFLSTDPTPSMSTQPVKKIYKTETVGKGQLTSAKLQAYQLAKVSSEVTSQSDSVVKLAHQATSQKEVYATSVSAQKAQQSSKSLAAQKASESQAKARTKQAVQAKKAVATKASHTSSKRDLNTGSKQMIIGNVNSHIYHVPGQAGYHMNAQNAVYFKTESQAQASGYRKAKR